MRRVPVLAVALVCVGGVPAVAAASWPVQGIPGSERGLEYRALTFGLAKDGSGVVGWWDTGSLSSPAMIWAAPVRPDAPGAAVAIGQPAPLGEPQVLPLVGGRIAVFGFPEAAVATGRLGGPLDVVLRWPAGTEFVPASAVSPRGDLAVLGPVRRSLSAAGRLVLSIRRPGHAIRKVTVSRRTTTRGYAVAVNGVGDALVAYDVRSRPPRGQRGVRHTVFARLVRAGRRAGPAYRLGRSRGFVTIDVALDDARRAVVGWFGRGCSEGGHCDEGIASAATAGPGGRFGRAVRLGRTPPASSVSNDRGAGPVLVALGARGRGTVAWNAAVGGQLMTVFAADVSRGRIRARQRLSDPTMNGWLADLASTSDDSAAVVWIAAHPGTPGSLSAAVRSGGGPFGASETVTDEPVSDIPIRVAFDPVSARPSVVYLPQPGPNPFGLALATRSTP